MSESFIFYDIYFTAIKQFKPKRQLKLFDAICNYCLYDKLPQNLDKEEFAVFSLIKFINDKYAALSSKEIRCSTAYMIWRKTVLKRDNFTCQLCGKTGDEVSLHAHHIRKFAIAKDERFNIDNGITLCKECHKNIHRREECQQN